MRLEGMKLARKLERVVVTAMGIASPLGWSIADFWDVFAAGKYETQKWPSMIQQDPCPTAE
jgi:hypothetical protein